MTNYEVTVTARIAVSPNPGRTKPFDARHEAIARTRQALRSAGLGPMEVNAYDVWPVQPGPAEGLD